MVHGNDVQASPLEGAHVPGLLVLGPLGAWDAEFRAMLLPNCAQRRGT